MRASHARKGVASFATARIFSLSDGSPAVFSSKQSVFELIEDEGGRFMSRHPKIYSGPSQVLGRTDITLSFAAPS